ncbi:MAG: alpha/beta fold hydrolase [Acidimicrobiales bacterium]
MALPGRGTVFVRERTGPSGAPALLLLHGWTASADLNWFAAYEPLGRGFSVVAADHRGHGRGLPLRRRFRLDQCADDAAALVASLGLGSVVVVGYSLGGAVAQVLWRRHRGLVDGLVLCATAHRFIDRPRERLGFAALGGLALVSRAVGSPLRRHLAHRLLGTRANGCRPLDGWALDQMSRHDWTAVLSAGAAIGRFDSRSWVGEIDVPTAVVATTGDRTVAAHRQLALAGAIPGATLHLVDGDHTVCARAPDRFVPVLVEACRSVVGRVTAAGPG